jgi:hypothetical protein
MPFAFWLYTTKETGEIKLPIQTTAYPADGIVQNPLVLTAVRALKLF